ncbi:MAG: M23 family metallopeptidase [Actinobacteria bacterium]|nr:M23 family metallopeptidase [Actinomycetota bacterium]
MSFLLALAFSVLGAPCWAPPVDAPIIDPYRAPTCTYCPGNRGIEYGPRPGQAVTAVAAGTVSFAGVVAGTRYVVIEHADGLRATYGRLATIAVARGASVTPGTRLGTTTDAFYFGLRRGVAPADQPVDPTPFLGVRRFPVRLVPIDGTPAPWPGPGRLSCRNDATAR